MNDSDPLAGWDFAGAEAKHSVAGLAMTPAERLRWLEDTLEELRPLVGAARRPTSNPPSSPAPTHPRKDTPMPQESWSDKDERQYDHVKESELERGKSEDEAEEIAARTVNKTRRQEGRTQNTTTMGTGNPNTRLEERTVDELRNRAQELDIEGRSAMNKDELVEAIRAANG